jgi:hypothetical protein
MEASGSSETTLRHVPLSRSVYSAVRTKGFTSKDRTFKRVGRGKLILSWEGKVMQKSQVVPFWAVSHVGGISSTAPLILNLGIKQT